MSDEPAECPLCMEALEIDDHSFFPCTCGYQICRFCWHRIRTDENGLCPACRKQYPEDPAEFKPLTEDELQNIKKERKQKDVQRKQKAAENRKHLANVRVVQRNLVFVVGLSPRLADPEVLKKHEYFGKFGKIHKVVINQSTSYAGSQGPSASAYVTYVKPEDALRAILTVNNIHVDGRNLKTSLGTTKYCSHFLKGTHCQKNDCMYLHELGEEAASFTKDEMQAGKHQEYEQMLIDQILNAQNSANNHLVTNNKLKKPVSPHAIEHAEVIPSLMDMTGDIKHSLSNSGPLLPNPGPPLSGGRVNGHTHAQSSNSGWPILEGAGSPSLGTGAKSEPSVINNNRNLGPINKLQQRTNTPPASSGGNNIGSNGRAVGNGRQRNANSTNSDENHIHNRSQASSVESISPSEELEENSSPTHNGHPSSAHKGLPLPTPVIHQTPSGASGTASLSTTQAQQLPELVDSSLSDSMVGAIGSNRRPMLSESCNSQGLSFFSNSLLNPKSTTAAAAAAGELSPLPPTSVTEDVQSSSLSSQEMADSLPVSSSTDWSAAFGFNSKEIPELPTDDDLGFDPCAESFKGLADLMEKENGMHQNVPSPPQANRLGSSPQQIGYPPQVLSHSPHQNNTHPPMRSLPPGFSMSQIQQQQQQLQQQQHFFRPELASGSKMLEFLPPFSQPTQQRFPPLHSFNSIPMDLHSQHQQQQQHHHHHQQHQQRDVYNMKDMQEQLRSMLPNINISFGAFPQQQQVPTSLHPTQQNQQLNKSWPLSSSPESSAWNDPAIVSSSQLLDNPGLFPESAPHWLKSLQQLTESDSPNHRLPFVQQFPLSGAGGWPTHTHNPPPGFRNAGLASQQATDSHQMAEVLQ